MTDPARSHNARRRASVVADLDLSMADHLSAALERCGAWQHLEASTALANDDASVVIVPELGGFELGSPSATDPRLVEVLVDLFHDRGYVEVAVGAGADSSAMWAANRDAYALTDLLGYGYVTPSGRDYDIVDLSDDIVPAPYPRGAVLAGTGLSSRWLDADLRIVVASNRTDDRDGYHLARATTMRALPYIDDEYHYRLAAPPDIVLGELLDATPVHLAIIDATVSSHGWSGSRAPRPLRTGCLIASTDVHVADRIGAIKMGLDPAVSSLAATDDRGPVGDLLIDGDLSTYAGWSNPPPALLRSTRRRDRSWWWSRLVPPWLQTLDAESFPLESPLDAWVNQRTAPFFGGIDADPVALDALIGANLALAAAGDAIEAYRTLFDKDELRRSDVSLGFDPETIPADDYEAVVPEIGGLAAYLADAPTRAPGLRWRRVDDAVVFDYRRSLPIPYDHFVGAVDVTGAISAMNDYLGGRTVALDHDDEGRVVRQAERNLYLPQPNYVALWGGLPIDVGKIEVAHHRTDSCALYWKTITSANDSAVADDGMVSFERSALGTTVVILGRQQFVLPRALHFVEQRLDPTLRDRLVTHAYATFFSRTIANFEALVEGRDIRIGRGATRADDPSAGEPMPSAALEKLVDDLVDWMGNLGGDVGVEVERGLVIDSDGFTHVPGTSPEPLVATVLDAAP